MLRNSASHSSRKLVFALGAMAALISAACSLAGAQVAPTIAVATNAALPALSATDSPASPTQAELSATPSGSPALVETAAPDTSGQARLVLASEGNEARYRVREQLANLPLPSDAVGVTSAVTGMIVLNTDGVIASGESKFVVDLTTLKSDQGLRDNFLQRNTLETRQYPTAEFVPLEAIGLPSPLPTSGEVIFQLAGDMTLHGVTRPTTWEVTAQIVNGQELVGSAVTRFTFGDFNLTIPRVGRVLSIEDNIQLELDFHLVLQG